MPAARKARQPRRTRTDQLLETQNQILDYLRQDVAEWRKAGERSDRQQRATLQALAAISKALSTLGESQVAISESQVAISESLARINESQTRQVEALRDIHAITTRVLEQSNHIMLQLGASGATH